DHEIGPAMAVPAGRRAGRKVPAGDAQIAVVALDGRLGRDGAGKRHAPSCDGARRRARAGTPHPVLRTTLPEAGEGFLGSDRSGPLPETGEGQGQANPTRSSGPPSLNTGRDFWAATALEPCPKLGRDKTRRTPPGPPDHPPRSRGGIF